MSLLHHTWMLELVLEEEQIVCGCHCYDILCGVPRCMQNLFIEVKAVDTDFILLAFASCTNLQIIIKYQISETQKNNSPDFRGAVQGDKCLHNTWSNKAICTAAFI